MQKGTSELTWNTYYFARPNPFYTWSKTQGRKMLSFIGQSKTIPCVPCPKPDGLWSGQSCYVVHLHANLQLDDIKARLMGLPLEVARHLPVPRNSYTWDLQWLTASSRAGRSPTSWIHGLALPGLAGTRGLASPIGCSFTVLWRVLASPLKWTRTRGSGLASRVHGPKSPN